MKTRVANVIFLAFITLTCSKSKDPVPNTILTGSWIGFNFELKDCVDPTFDTDGPCKCDTLVFYSSTFADKGSISTQKGTYSIKENNLTFIYDGNAPIVATYTMKSDTVTITYPALSNNEPNNGCVEIIKIRKIN